VIGRRISDVNDSSGLECIISRCDRIEWCVLCSSSRKNRPSQCFAMSLDFNSILAQVRKTGSYKQKGESAIAVLNKYAKTITKGSTDSYIMENVMKDLEMVAEIAQEAAVVSLNAFEMEDKLIPLPGDISSTVKAYKRYTTQIQNAILALGTAVELVKDQQAALKILFAASEAESSMLDPADTLSVRPRTADEFVNTFFDETLADADARIEEEERASVSSRTSERRLRTINRRSAANLSATREEPVYV